MINLIKLEFYKLRKQNVFKILLLMVILISVLSSISALSISRNEGISLTGRQSYIEAFHDVSMLFVCAVFVGIYIGSDFSNRTIQAQIATGQTRWNILISKVIGFATAAVFIMLLYPLTGAIVVTMKLGWGALLTSSEIVNLIEVTLQGIIVSIGTSSLFVLFAFCFRDIAKTICFSIAFPVIFSIVKPLINNIPIAVDVMNFFSIAQMRNIGINDGGNLSFIILSSIFTVVFTTVITYIVFKKAEIK